METTICQIGIAVNTKMAYKGKMSENNSEKKQSEAGVWLRRRDAWMRMLVSSPHVSRNGKITGVYVALRLSAKRPATYPAMKTMARDLDISTRQVARALKELEEEEYLRVKRNAGKTSLYSLDL